MNEVYHVYCWVNLTNGKRRVGHTINFLKRIREHKNISKKSDKPFYKALQEFPIKQGHWIIESWEVSTKDKMFFLEKWLKLRFKTIDSQFGYDEVLDEEESPMLGKIGEKASMFGKHHSKQSIQKIKNNQPNAKTVLLISPEGIKLYLKGYKSFCKENSLDQCNICNLLKGKYRHHKGWTGHFITEEEYQKNHTTLD